MREPPWMPAWRAAVAANVNDARAGVGPMRGLVDVVRGCRGASSSLVAVELARAIRAVLPYSFAGEAHEIVSVRDAAARGGTGACADGAAAAAAAVLSAAHDGGAVVVDGDGVARVPRVALCYEIVRGNSSYAHARVLLGAHPVEPWPEFRRPEAQGCALLYDVSVEIA